MITDYIGQGFKLEFIAPDKLGQKISKAYFYAVARVYADYQRLGADFTRFHLPQIIIQRTLLFDFLLQNKETSLRVVPAVAVLNQLCLYRSYFKHLNVFVCAARACIRVQSARREVAYKICLFKRGRAYFIISVFTKDSKRRL